MVKYHQNSDNPTVWLENIRQARGDDDIMPLKTALGLYNEQMLSQMEKGIHIADILLQLGLDTETLAATVAYPAVLSKEVHLDTVSELLNESCRKLIADVLQMQSLSNLQSLPARNQHQIENLRKMLLSMVTDVRAVLIILAERLTLLRQAKSLNSQEQKHLAQETQAVYAPLANRLGVWQLKWEIEDLCLRYLQPEIYSKIARWLVSRREERELYIKRAITTVTDLLKTAGLKNYDVTGRVKHIDSIYLKMQRKGSSFDEIFDISALRVLVPTIPDCYQVLSILQDSWQHIPEEFDDYISQPKPNGYRSIHTVLIGPEERVIEVQIRTNEMHQESELGVAAHWRYKEKILQTSSYEAKIALLRQIMAWQKEVATTDNASHEQVPQDLFADRIYVFTPTNDIIDLANGATPLDFAYHIHSEVGHRCRGAKVDGKIVPLTYQLQTGERIEILTAKAPNPSRDWLNPHLGYLNTPRARAKAQHWFRIRDNTHTLSEARELLDKELKKHDFNEKPDLNAIAHKLNFKNGEDVLLAFAAGDVRLAQILQHTRTPTTTTPNIQIREAVQTNTSGIQVTGINNLLSQIARCCKPLPGDPVLGYVTRNRGVSIHKRDCRNIAHAKTHNARKLLEVNWGAKQIATYPVDLILHTYDRSGLLRDITTLLAAEKINVLGLQTDKNIATAEADIYITIEIANINQLQQALSLLIQVPNVLDARRR